MDVRVGEILREGTLENAAGSVRIVDAGIDRRRKLVIGHLLVTENAVAAADLELVEPVGMAHERLFRDIPTQREGREVAPVVLAGELGRSVPAESRRDQIPVVIGVERASQPGNHDRTGTASIRDTFRRGVAQFADAGGHSGALSFQDAIVDVLIGVADQRRYLMLAEGVVVGQQMIHQHIVASDLRVGHLGDGAALQAEGIDSLVGGVAGELEVRREVDLILEPLQDFELCIDVNENTRLLARAVHQIAVDHAERILVVHDVAVVAAIAAEHVGIILLQGRDGRHDTGDIAAAKVAVGQQVVVVGSDNVGSGGETALGEVQLALDIVALEVTAFDRAVAVVHADAGVVLRVLAAALHGDVVVLDEGIVEEDVLPVIVLLFGEVLSHVLGRKAVGCAGFRGNLGPLGGVEHGEFLGRVRDTEVERGVDLGHAVGVGAALGGDDHHTVGGAGTINGGRGGIFQHVNALDIVGVDIVQRAHVHAVHDVERLRIVEGADTADHDAGAGAGGATVGNDVNAGDLALEGLADGGVARGVELVRGDIGHSAGQVGLALNTVADNDHFVEQAGIDGKQDDWHVLAGRHLLGFVADAGNLEDRAGGNVAEDIVAAFIGHGTDVGADHDDAGSDDRFVRLRVEDLSPDLDAPSLLGQGLTGRCRQGFRPQDASTEDGQDEKQCIESFLHD